MRGREKWAVPAAALALASGVVACGEHNEAPDAISGGNQLETNNSFLQSAATQIGRTILRFKTQLVHSSPVSGEATVYFNKKLNHGSISINLMAIMHENKEGPDPNTTEAVSILNVDEGLGAHYIILSKESGNSGKESSWLGKIC
jgi:hypothetical protein